MSFAADMALAAARMIAKNEGRAVPDKQDHAHAEWAIAGIVQAWKDEGRQLSPPVPGPDDPVPQPPVAATHHDGGGNVHERGPTALGGPEAVLREQAKLKGYGGDACSTCGNFTLVRNGTCMRCDTCGGTSGCS